jgi:lipopolysaccharide transport system ATP-binding protein
MPRSIVVDNITKTYQLGESSHTMIRDAAMAMFGKLFRREQPASRKVATALGGVSFEVERGEVVGLIGRNGAGKSTLLKILSKITHPTTGTVNVTGRVGSLLEVGTGFHEELTGRENIYLNGSILGMRKREIDAGMEQIVEYADINDFLDTPIKRYSSGMRMRLGFSVAAHLNTDVLFVDEVLAVGDVGFQKKCLGTMRELGQSGRTLLFVSHNMAAIENLCKRTIWIAGGKVEQDGPTKDVIRAYLKSFGATEQNSLDLTGIRERKGTGEAHFLKMEFLNDEGGPNIIHSGESLKVRLHFECVRDIPDLHFGLRIYSSLGVLVTEATTKATNEEITLARKGRGSIDLEIDFLNLMPGTYYIGAWAASIYVAYDYLDNIAKLEVEPSDYYGTGRGIDARYGLVFLPYQWKLQSEGLPADEAPTELVHSDSNESSNGVLTVQQHGDLVPAKLTASEKPLISVIIPCYNAGHFVEHAVTSALAQTYPSVEVIVVDDGSTDDTRVRLQPWADRIKYIHQSNGGPAKARNRGIRESHGSLIAFLDADDEWHEDKLAIQESIFRNDGRVTLVHTDLTCVEVGSGRRFKPSRAREKYKGLCYKPLFFANHVNLSTVMVRRELVEAVGFFDENRLLAGCEDYDLWIRLARTHEFAYEPRPLTVYRLHTANLSHDPLRMAEALLLVADKALTADPELGDVLGRDRVRIHMCNLALQAASTNVDAGDLRRARRHFRSAIGYAPRTMKTWALWASTFLPVSVRDTLLHLKKKVVPWQNQQDAPAEKPACSSSIPPVLRETAAPPHEEETLAGANQTKS